MSGDLTVDLSFRGIKLARGARLDDQGDSAFVTYETPLPVGSKVVVDVPGSGPREARVVGIIEQEAGGKAEAGMRRRRPLPKSPARLGFRGRTWATRRGVQIDRIASAWLIRRFIDPRARFRFVDPKERPLTGELRFDMPGGDFSHEGDRCTFETLIARAGLEDASLAEIAQIVHDIDLKDGKFARPEAPGLERLLIGLILSSPRDEARLERGSALFDQLYRSFQKKAPLLTMEVPK
jgi:hypothetical protein